MAGKSLQKKIQHQAYRIVIWQFACVVLLAVVAAILRGKNSGFSVFIGGAAYVLPNLLFVWRVFRYAGAQEMAKFMSAFFIGEMLKLMLSAILFLMIVKYLPVSLLSLLIGFIGAIVAFWVVCLWQFSSKNSSQVQGAAE
jgi:ATP synthase protein I